MEKIKIEKNSVQETLVLPLYGKAWASQNYPDIFKDRDAQKIMNSIDYDFSAMEKAARGVKGKIASLAAATRQAALVWEINDYLKDHPKALVVNLGCGLDTAGHQADNGKCCFANVDFPNVIELREKLLPSTEREKNIPSDLNDHSWFEKIGFIKEDGAVFIASGVFLYFKKDDVKKLFCAMAERFPGARLAFDGQNEAGKNLDLKALQTSGIDISTNFYLNHPEEKLKSWSDKFARVQWKKMSTGYILPDKRFGLLYRLMAPYAGNTGMSQLDVIDFQKE
ncbi:MAG: class I SAM-dependent methyltransferase [Anaerolineaceae bacterium]|nr:class I SAM-dependent methyltransferase [Anaerolineaceae bacterium]